MSIDNALVASLVTELQKTLLKQTMHTIKTTSERTFLLEFDQGSLLVCLQEPFLRFHLVEKKYPTAESHFTLKLENHLKNVNLHSVNQLNEDRILQLDFSHFKLIVELFPKRPNLYLTNPQNEILLTLNPTQEKVYSPPKKPVRSASVAGPKMTSRELELLYLEKEKEAQFHKEKQAHYKKLEDRKLRLQRAEQKFVQEMGLGKSWEKKKHEAELLKANYFRLRKGMKQMELLDWENEDQPTLIPLDPTLEPKEEIAYRFSQAKKLQTSLQHLQKQLERVHGELQQIQLLEKKLEAAESLEALQATFGRTLKPEKSPPLETLPYREYATGAGLKIWVGKDAASNEKLTFSLARGNDYWFHVHHFPGAHVVLRMPHGSQEPDLESVLDAIQIAFAYSGAKNRGVAEVCMTQVKYVSRLKRGKQGQVQISKHKLLQAKFDAERFQKIKARG